MHTHNTYTTNQSDRLLALGWRAAQKKKPVIMVSTESCAKPTTVTSVATRRASVKLKVVDNYNRSMNGVDQYTEYYSFIRKSVKWWRKLFFWLFEVTIVNSYILYCTHTSNPCTHLQFRQSLVEALVSSHLAAAPPRPRLGRPRKCSQSASEVPEGFNLQLRHFPKRGKNERVCVLQ